MKKFCLVLSCFLIATETFCQEKRVALEHLHWMTGCWELRTSDQIVEEQWMKPAGGMIVGMGRTLSNEKAIFFEFLQILDSDSGIYYVARPRGAKPTPFKLVKSSKTEASFENMQHDFPQRIIYRKDSGSNLLARVEGIVEGEMKYEEFRYSRKPCD